MHAWSEGSKRGILTRCCGHGVTVGISGTSLDGLPLEDRASAIERCPEALATETECRRDGAAGTLDGVTREEASHIAFHSSCASFFCFGLARLHVDVSTWGGRAEFL